MPSPTGTAHTGPLHDVRVLEFAQALAIPSCGALLADMGADVVKIEPPAGDNDRLHQRTILSGDGLLKFQVFIFSSLENLKI